MTRVTTSVGGEKYPWDRLPLKTSGESETHGWTRRRTEGYRRRDRPHVDGHCCVTYGEHVHEAPDGPDGDEGRRFRLNHVQLRTVPEYLASPGPWTPSSERTEP